ncbi:hypothetical protein cypCar_00042753 [Cyprinus carpio]|nr:hypothetical protein cypCar_00042753 [Cyprinus carpio]
MHAPRPATEDAELEVTEERLEEVLTNLKVDVVRRLCKQCGLDPSGSKMDLVVRLREEMRNSSDGFRWDTISSDGFRWDTISSDGFRWDTISSDGFRWDTTSSDGFRWDTTSSDGFRLDTTSSDGFRLDTIIRH